jgi:hypothetical protein
MIVLFLLLLAQGHPDEGRVKCTSVGGPIPLGTERVTVPLKCCPEKSFVKNPDHPTDSKGNLICAEEV